jgi:hypothetical protein
VKLTLLLETPFTVTTTLPVVAPAGTGARIVVAFQLVGVALTPLKVTVLVPWVTPKPVPVIVTEVPGSPAIGLRVAMAGATVKMMPLLAMPPTVTTTLPVVAPAGTGTTMLVGLQLVGVAAVPLNVIVLVPWLAPKLTPAMVTDVPTAAEVGDKLVMLGAASTVKLIQMLAPPDT